MDNEDIGSKKLTLQGLSKIKVGAALSASTSGTTVIKKRRKKNQDDNDLFDASKLGFLTEKEQISRINAVQNAVIQKNNKLKEKIADESFINQVEIPIQTINEKPLESLDIPQESEQENKSKGKVSKDAYSKHSKLVIEQAIDEKIEQQPKQKYGIKRKKHQFTKGKNISRHVVIPDTITIKELCMRMAEDSKVVLKILKEEVGENYKLTDEIDPYVACEIVKKFGHVVQRVSQAHKEKDLFSLQNKEDLPQKPKPPVVTFMGHVDHGKTSLLDAFRKSDIVAKEFGGITQHIGAYQTTTSCKQKITFIDTPGHEAFTAMRACGANVTNIVVIVIAADDGIMKQTIEAINHAKAANVAIIVAVNKIDKSQPGAVDKIINGLTQYDLIPESLGGDIMVIPVSAKNKINLDKLEEAILLIAELMDLRTVVDCRALGWVIESKIDKARGISATLIVEEGTLKVGDFLVIGTIYGKIRNMTNHLGQREKVALPSTPVEITGLSGVPNAGDKFVVVKSEKQAREVVEYRLELVKKKEGDSNDDILDIFSHNKEIEELSVILKCDVTGSIEAISNSISELGKNQVELNILHKAVGGVTESDVLLAEASNGMILAFNVKVEGKIKDLAKQKGVEIHVYSIIYELIDDMKMYLRKMLKPITKEEHLGSSTVRQVFNTSKASNIIGCYVNDGIIKKDSLIKVLRGSKLIYKGKLKALRRFKEDVKEVRTNFECGMSIEGSCEIKVNDVLEVYRIVQEERAL